MNASDLDVKIHFLDYGNDYVVDIKNVMQLPASLLQSCCSHTVEVKLTSNRSIEDIDADETRGSLLDKNDFYAKVEMLPGSDKYAITIDDALVIFKK